MINCFYTFQKFKNKRYQTIKNKGKGKISYEIWGKNNKLNIEQGCKFRGLKIYICGNDNIIYLKNNVVFGEDCLIFIYGNNNVICIDKGSTFTLGIKIYNVEDNNKIIIGKDCMFSNSITLRTSDGHPIYNNKTGERINQAKDIMIGNHIWVAPDCKILKGAIIPDGCIIGSNTIVSKPIEEENTLIVGIPGKIKKRNIKWERNFN